VESLDDLRLDLEEELDDLLGITDGEYYLDGRLLSFALVRVLAVKDVSPIRLRASSLPAGVGHSALKLVRNRVS